MLVPSYPADPTQAIDAYVQERIKYRAGRLGQAFQLAREDVDDLKQDLAAEVLRAWPRFDPAKSCWATFVTRVLDRRYAHLARRIRTERENLAKQPTSLTAIPELPDDALATQKDLQLDVPVLLQELTPRLRTVATALMTCRPAQADKPLRMHRSTVYRNIAKLRLAFAEHGYGPGGN